jgi:hypothetical protein
VFLYADSESAIPLDSITLIEICFSFAEFAESAIRSEAPIAIQAMIDSCGKR